MDAPACLVRVQLKSVQLTGCDVIASLGADTLMAGFEKFNCSLRCSLAPRSRSSISTVPVFTNSITCFLVSAIPSLCKHTISSRSCPR